MLQASKVIDRETKVLEKELGALGDVKGISFDITKKEFVLPITFVSEEDKSTKMRILVAAILVRGAFQMKLTVHISEDSSMDPASAHRMIIANLRGYDVPFSCVKVSGRGDRYIAVSVM